MPTDSAVLSSQDDGLAQQIRALLQSLSAQHQPLAVSHWTTAMPALRNRLTQLLDAFGGNNDSLFAASSATTQLASSPTSSDSSDGKRDFDAASRRKRAKVESADSQSSAPVVKLEPGASSTASSAPVVKREPDSSPSLSALSSGSGLGFASPAHPMTPLHPSQQSPAIHAHGASSSAAGCA